MAARALPSHSADDTDRRFMAAAIRLSRHHLGLTATNPSVGTLIVRDDGNGPRIVGRGVTAVGGRPHAEPQALAEAGDLARGATAYVTLEPCAHHGHTPPCAETLITAGVARVVGATTDPDPRVSGRGYAMLREAGIAVVEPVLADEAADLMAGYLIRSVRKRPEVTLKLAVSADGMVGRKGEGHVAITGDVARAQVHAMRAEADAILVGIGTVLADNPQLTCRLPGMESRSPVRIVLDREIRLPTGSRLALSAGDTSVLVASSFDADPARRRALTAAGVEFIGADLIDGLVALPELLDDLAGRGIATLMVEGGAKVAAQFLADGLVDRIALFSGSADIGSDGIASPITRGDEMIEFRMVREAVFGDDRYGEWTRDI
ncbi:MAG: bifunctional diaminohydroxyphosphoribosylaminopyrimidine deaminase/5-amino-6-(5-phosphoribosylamino)uracil reductase RibD [Rhizobiaceae bacterium]